VAIKIQPSAAEAPKYSDARMAHENISDAVDCQTGDHLLIHLWCRLGFETDVRPDDELNE
jgi:hypothetical protein